MTEMELEGLKADAFILRSRNVSGRLLVVCAGRTIGPLDWTLDHVGPDRSWGLNGPLVHS